MHAAEVVIGEEQGERRFMVLPFLAVGIRQPRHAANGHTEREIQPLDMRGADAFLDRRAGLDGFDNLGDA
jgi:hypothetical protein